MSDLLNCWKCGHEAYVEEGDYDYCLVLEKETEQAQKETES